MKKLLFKSMIGLLFFLAHLSAYSQVTTKQEYDSLKNLLNTVALNDTTKLDYLYKMHLWEIQLDPQGVAPSLLQAQRLAEQINDDKAIIKIYSNISYQVPDSLFLGYAEKMKNYFPKIPSLDFNSVKNLVYFYTGFRGREHYIEGLKYLQSLEPYFSEEKDCDNLVMILLGRGELMGVIKNEFSERFYYKKAAEKAIVCGLRDLELFSKATYAKSFFWAREYKAAILQIQEIFLDSIGMDNEYRSALYIDLADSYFYTQNYTAAQEVIQEVIDINHRYYPFSAYLIGAKMEIALQSFEKAQAYFQLIEDNYQSILYKNSYSEVLLSSEKGKLFTAMEKYDSAEIILLSCLNIMEGYPDQTNLEHTKDDCIAALLDLYKKTGNNQQIIKYQQLIIDKAEAKAKANMAAQAVQFEANRIEQTQKTEINNLSSTNKKQKILLFATIAFISVLLLLGGVIFKQRQKLTLEKQKSEALLLNVLPPPIATRMKSGENPIADYFDEATVVFIDMANFTSMSSVTSPQQILHLLNEIFTRIDTLTEQFGMEKIKTIGDCYMAVAGIPISKENHLEKAILFSQTVLTSFADMDYFGHKIEFKIGIETGPAIAGVIGEKRFLYDLWGDTVNTASRMESFGKPGIIQTTKNVKEKAGHLFEFKSVGVIEVKGKGAMELFQVEC